MPTFSNILIAPAPFKGVLTASDAGDAIKEGILVAQPGANVKVLPMADGGMGTSEAVYKALGGILRELDVSGPMGNLVRATYTIIDKPNFCHCEPELVEGEAISRDESKTGDRHVGLRPPRDDKRVADTPRNDIIKTAIIDMASAAGYIHAPEEIRNPLHATTRGVGQLIADAIDQGCKEIIIGLGDSATIDVGIGMISELGAKFLDSHGGEVPPILENFAMISRIDMSGVNSVLKNIKFLGYADVLNPVVGCRGTAAPWHRGTVEIFGPQKGVTSEMMPKLEAGVERIVELMENKFDVRLHDEPMTGAAGGLGAGIRAFLNGSLIHGAHAIAKLINLESHIKKADLVITGEGKLDKQSLSGKVISEVLRLAVNNNKPCWAIVGRSTLTKSRFEKIIEISPNRVPISSDEARKLIRGKSLV